MEPYIETDYREYPEYKELFQNLCNWILKQPKYSWYPQKQVEEFAENIINKKHKDLLNILSERARIANKKAYAKYSAELIKIKTQIYGENCELVHTDCANVGDCFVLVSKTGKVHYMKCIELRKKHGYDYGEWCVSERDYTYTVPIFIEANGKHAGTFGMAKRITEEEFNKAKEVLKNE